MAGDSSGRILHQEKVGLFRQERCSLPQMSARGQNSSIYYHSRNQDHVISLSVGSTWSSCYSQERTWSSSWRGAGLAAASPAAPRLACCLLWWTLSEKVSGQPEAGGGGEGTGLTAGLVEDVLVVPVNISYDRIVERKFVKNELMVGLLVLRCLLCQLSW